MYRFDFKQLQQEKKLKRIYKDSICKHIDKYKCNWYVIDEYDDKTEHYQEQILLLVLRGKVKSALKDNDILYVETHSKRKYILIPKNKRIG